MGRILHKPYAMKKLHVALAYNNCFVSNYATSTMLCTVHIVVLRNIFWVSYKYLIARRLFVIWYV